MNALQVAWFVLIGVLLAGYVILDGYDLGIGFWHLISRSESDRKALRRAIAPYWDANEVWLITAGGALFAAFPMVYATVFSAFYLPLMLVVFSLIFRAVSIEFIEHASSPRMHRFWEIGFGLGSTVPMLLFGVAMGNILRGLPLDSHGNYTGTFFDLLNPYSLLVGLAGFALFAMHGALFVQMTQKGDVAARAKWWALCSSDLAVVLVMFSWVATALLVQHRLGHMRCLAVGLGPLVLSPLPAVLIYNRRGQSKKAFLASCTAIVFLLANIGAALFPNFVPARAGGRALTIANSSSSPLTLAIMLGVAAVGMVVVLGYTIWVRRVFSRGEGGEY